MPSLTNPFKKSLPGAETQRRFENWPDPPPIKAVPAGKSGLPLLLDSSTGTQLVPRKYGPAIIIGLGRSGEIALRQWLEKLSEDPAGAQTGLRSILITHQPPTQPLPNHVIKTRLLQLEQLQTMIGLRSAPKGPRGEVNVLFRQVVNYRSFIEWLRDSLLDLNKEIQVFVVGSLAEPMIGLVGDILQILRALPESPSKDSPYANITALLSMTASGPESLSQEEIYAAQREIGRFTFNGPHVTETSFGLNRMASSALLDHLFLVEGFSENLRYDFNGTPFELGIGQVLSEAIFTLSHPAAAKIWENLAKDLRQSGQLRSELHKVVAHSLGIATLYVPIGAVQEYIAARLAYAALFGEKSDRAEGLLALHDPHADYRVEARLTARHWLLEGPCKHPLFTWLLDTTSPTNFLTVPRLSTDHEAIFRAQLSHGLVNFLNGSTGSDLDLANAALEFLAEHLARVAGWFESVKVQNPNAPERLTFQSLLSNWRETLQHFISTVQAWQRTLQPAPAAYDTASAAWNPDTQPASAVVQADWRSRSVSHPTTAAPTERQPSSVAEFLQQARRVAETGIIASARGRVYRSVTADLSGELKEVDAYYQDSVRPELSRYITENSPAFTRVRERLEWWVSLAPGRQPELLLLCWPPDATVEPGGNPPPEGCFKPADAEALGAALLMVSRTQVQRRAADLTGAWFRKRIEKMADFLRRATNAYIAFDLNMIALLPNAATRRSYLIARDPVMSRTYLSHAFPDTPRLEINELGGGEATRFTALTFRLNIPTEAIYTFQQAYPEYQNKSAESQHLYAQEAAATIYEKRIWNLERERILLPPDLAVVLADQQLVTLFCQAAFCRLVAVQYDKHDQNPQWIVVALGKEFTRLPLALADADGLFQALRCFALDLPNHLEVDRNTTNPFYAHRREYISELTKAVKDHAVRPEARAYREEFKKTILEDWRRRGEHDLLAKAFAHLLNAELDEPVWKGWQSFVNNTEMGVRT